MAFPVRVERPIFEPHKCTVLGKGDDPIGWVDCGNINSQKPDPRSYISHGGVLTAARLFGYDIPSLLEDKAERAVLEAKVAVLEAELDEERQFSAAIDVIESADFRARKKPGRKVAA